MDFQVGFNLAIGLAAFFVGYYIKTISESIRDLKAVDTILVDKVQKIELLVAGKYVTREDMEKMISALFAKLDKIDVKLDTKQDKHPL